MLEFYNASLKKIGAKKYDKCAQMFSWDNYTNIIVHFFPYKEDTVKEKVKRKIKYI